MVDIEKIKREAHLETIQELKEENEENANIIKRLEQKKNKVGIKLMDILRDNAFLEAIAELKNEHKNNIEALERIEKIEKENTKNR